jgi:aryl-alcohol dehydrogenase-like predicted oxidoreductase
MMNRRQLGNSELFLSEIGFGAWAIGGGDWEYGWGAQDDRESIAAIHKALDLGINWIDTAAVYGLGHSEEVVAQALKGIRKETIVATKCSLIWDENRKVGTSLEADSVRNECEASLRRLNTDYIDLYQIHFPSDEENIEEAWIEIHKLKEEGKIRYCGVSNFSVDHLKRADALHPITSLQPPYSMLRRGIEDSQMKYCGENNIGIVAYSPMQCGLLTGSFDITRLKEDDWRKESNEFQEPNLSINIEFADSLKPIAEKYEKSVAQLAIGWTLRNVELTSAIVGARRPDQIIETAGGADFEISSEDIEKIDELLNGRLEKIRAKEGYIL